MDELAKKYQRLAEWFQTPLGQLLLEEEQSALKSFFEKIPGEYLLILGDVVQTSLAVHSRLKEKVVLSPYYAEDLNVSRDNMQLLCVDYEALPIAQDSVDAILLPHTLEFVDHPDQVLREVEIVLRPEGYLMIIGFNPISLCGLRHLFSLNKHIPWSGSFRTVSRIKDWLKLLNFEIVDCKRSFYHLPVAGITTFPQLKCLNYINRYFLSIFGGVYVLMAKKRVFGVTPLRMKWKEIATILPKSMVEPVRKGIHREQNS